ncbi:MAG: FliH/SctL family protein [Eubacteriales bacterium]|nr:FliH/SctL family protein [Eubacteriales bacterium]MDD4683520.1 FliH/SctL family protein [Eubacteriales bacterium]
MAKIHKSPNVYMDSEHPNNKNNSGIGAIGQQVDAGRTGREENDFAAHTDEDGTPVAGQGKSFRDIFQSIRKADSAEAGEAQTDKLINNKATTISQGQSYASANRGSAPTINREDVSVQQILRRAEDEAERIIAEARQQAALVLQQNKLKVMAEKQAGYQDGFREGQTAAQVMYEQQLTQLQKSFYEIASEMSRKPEELLSGMEDDLLDLALDIAEKVIGAELSRKNKSYQAFLHRALNNLKKQEKATVYLNDREYQLFVAAQPDMFADDMGTIQFVGDDKLPPGSCLIETTRGRFDASVDVQLKKIGKAMRD